MINGGIVKGCAPWPRDKSKTALKCVFSGGKWTPSANWVVTQFRNYRKLGRWRVTSVGYFSGFNTDTLLVVAPDCGPDHEREYTFQAGDVLVLGDGTYTELEFGDTDLTLMANASLEIGPERNRGIALLSESPASEWVKPKQAVMFHKEGVKLAEGQSIVWWRDRSYQASFLLSDSYLDNRLQAVGEKIKTLSDSLRWSVVDVLEAQVESVLSLQQGGLTLEEERTLDSLISELQPTQHGVLTEQRHPPKVAFALAKMFHLAQKASQSSKYRELSRAA